MIFMSDGMNKVYLHIHCELILEVHECVYIIYILVYIIHKFMDNCYSHFLFLMYTSVYNTMNRTIRTDKKSCLLSILLRLIEGE